MRRPLFTILLLVGGAALAVSPEDPIANSHSATLLYDGRVLIAGGVSAVTGDDTAQAVLYDPLTRTLVSTGSLTAPRNGHSATLLRNGKVLIAGGRNAGVTRATAELYDPVTGTFSALPAMSIARREHTATLLASGKVLVVGGCRESTITEKADLFDPATNTWSSAAPLPVERYGHTAVLQSDGKVLITGGHTNAALAILFPTDGSTYGHLYNPSTNTWSSVTSGMSEYRGFHTSTMQPDGRVTVVGGVTIGSSTAVTRYNPATGTFQAAADNLVARNANSASLLGNGRLLVTGGTGAAGSSVEIYNASTNTWTLLPAMSGSRLGHTSLALAAGDVLLVGGSNATLFERYDPQPLGAPYAAGAHGSRASHTATLLTDGRVLLVGGDDGSGNALASAMVYASGAWSAAAPVLTPRTQHSATLISPTTVLVAGGSNGATLRTTEVFDLTANAWTAGPPLQLARRKHTATLLPNGTVLLAGGLGDAGSIAQTELFDWAGNQLVLGPALAQARVGHTATLLLNGKVLIAGGAPAEGGAATASAELFDPVTRALTPLPQNLKAARERHTASLLPDGRVLLVGGLVAGAPSTSVELFDPASGAFTLGPPLSAARASHAAAVLPVGKVLVAGGGPSAVEVFDPVRNRWSTHGSLAQSRSDLRATLLSTGRALVTGGRTGASAVSTAELAFDGRADDALLKPKPTASIYWALPGGELTVGGSDLYLFHDADSGAMRSGSSRVPTVLIRRADSEAIRRLSVTSATDAQLKAAVPADLQPGLYELRVGVAGALSDAVSLVVVQPSSPSGALRFTTPPRSTLAGQCSSALTVELTQSGLTSNAASTVSLALSTPSATGRFYLDAACQTAAVTQAVLSAGTSATTFYYSDTSAGAVSLGVSGGGWGGAAQTHTSIAPPHHVNFSIPANPQVGVTYAVTFQVVDALENPIGPATVTATVAPDGSFTAADSAAALVSQLSATASATGGSSAVIHFRSLGTATVCAYVSSAQTRCQTVNVVPGPPAEIAVTAPVSVNEATPYLLAFQLKDAQQNDTASAAITLSLSGSGTAPCAMASSSLLLDASTGRGSVQVLCSGPGTFEVCGQLSGLSDACASTVILAVAGTDAGSPSGTDAGTADGGAATGADGGPPGGADAGEGDGRKVWLSAQAVRAEVALGGKATIAVQVKNERGTALRAPTLLIDADPGVSVLSIRNAAANGQLGDLLPGESVQVEIDLRVTSPSGSAPEVRTQLRFADGSLSEQQTTQLAVVALDLPTGCSCQSGAGALPFASLALLLVAARGTKRRRRCYDVVHEQADRRTRRD